MVLVEPIRLTYLFYIHDLILNVQEILNIIYKYCFVYQIQSVLMCLDFDGDDREGRLGNIIISVCSSAQCSVGVLLPVETVRSSWK